jgi:glutathione S-transferase
LTRFGLDLKFRDIRISKKAILKPPIGLLLCKEVLCKVLAETGLERYDLKSEFEGKHDKDIFSYWLHFAEGSAMLQILSLNFVSLSGKTSKELVSFLSQNVCDIFTLIENHLRNHEYFVGNNFSAADIMMSTPIRAGGLLVNIPSLVGEKTRQWLAKVESRPAYLAAEAKDGLHFKLSRSKSKL